MKEEIAAAIQYKEAIDTSMLLEVEFESVHDYLFLLRDISKSLEPLKRRAMLYLAAAVSDFYIPEEKMVSFVHVMLFLLI